MVKRYMEEETWENEKKKEMYEGKKQRRDTKRK